MKKTQSKKSSNTNSYKVIELPSNNDEMEKFLDDNRVKINEKIVNSIDHALKKRLAAIEMFRFKNSNFIVLINRKDFKENLENIFNFSLDNENFEICGRAKKVMEKIERMNHIFQCKKINKKYVKIKKIKKQEE